VIWRELSRKKPPNEWKYPEELFSAFCIPPGKKQQRLCVREKGSALKEEIILFPGEIAGVNPDVRIAVKYSLLFAQWVMFLREYE
jgi:hypothetical protein